MSYPESMFVKDERGDSFGSVLVGSHSGERVVLATRQGNPPNMKWHVRYLTPTDALSIAECLIGHANAVMSGVEA